jgi:hypothetical protein
MSLVWRPMPLVRIPEAFTHRDWLFELKHDGFRALRAGAVDPVANMIYVANRLSDTVTVIDGRTHAAVQR